MLYAGRVALAFAAFVPFGWITAIAFLWVNETQLVGLHGLGYSVLSLDYFGRNDGEPSEPGLYNDATAAYRYLTDVEGVNPSRIVLAGRSLGSAVAVELAMHVSSAGLLLFSAIDSVPSVGARLYPWAPVRWLVSYRFDSLAKIGRITVPIVIVHAAGDRVVPIETARALYERVTGPRLLLETSGEHDDAGFHDVKAFAGALGRFWPTVHSVLP